MTLFYLVRHARAEGKHPGGDAARRLTPDGRARFAAHARALRAELRVSSIVTSPFARARETADLLAAATGAPVLEERALASGTSSAQDLLALGARLGDGAALVGHNPEFADAVALVAGGVRELEPGAVAAVDADGTGYRLAWVRAPG